MFQPVLASLQIFGTFSQDELQFFKSKLTSIDIRKNDFILKEGAICQSIYFIIQGSCMHLLPSANETDTVVNLYTNNNWFTDYQSFTSQKPALTFIQAYTDCQLATLNIHALHELIQHSPVFFKAGRLLETMQYTDITTLHLSPEEKYRDLLERKPELLQIFPLKIVASYLRITPETLSRIRKRIK
jgi:CRP-like cAMP-binding protein